MAQTPQRFFEDAIELSGSLNQASLVRKIGIKSPTYTDWKKGRSYPSDKTMLKIALLCDLDPVEALALLNLWRCDEAAKSTYERLLDVAQSTAMKCCIAFFAANLTFLGNFGKFNDNNDLTISSHEKISHNFPEFIIMRFGRHLKTVANKPLIPNLT